MAAVDELLADVATARVRRDVAQSQVDVDLACRRIGRNGVIGGVLMLVTLVVSGILDGLIVPVNTLSPLPELSGVLGVLLSIFGACVYATFTFDDDVDERRRNLLLAEHEYVRACERLRVANDGRSS